MSTSTRAELYQELQKMKDDPRIKPFDGHAYTLYDFQREIAIYERLARAWKMKFVQSILQPQSSIWYGYGDDGAPRGAVKAESFEGDLSTAESVTFWWETVNQGMLAAGRIGIGMALVAESKGKLFACKFQHLKIDLHGDGEDSLKIGFERPRGSRIEVSRRTDKGFPFSEQDALVIRIPMQEFREIQEP